MANRKKEALHPAEQYAQDVIDGKTTACKWVRLACERHFHDLEHGHKRGLWFDSEDAKRILHFKSMLRHSKGKWGGERLVLEPWQQFKDWVIFGWKKKDGTRRFRSAYIEVARKNGKSTDSAGSGLFLAFADGEAGAEVYSAATKRDQARIVHQEAIRMVRKNSALKKYIKIYKDNLSIERTASKYEPLGGDSDSLDGLNVHGAIVDELHAHKNRETLELLETATGAREQPLIIMITTAGADRYSICWEKHEYTEKVLEGWKDASYLDDSWFGIIYTLDEGDDWADENVWVKANPNLNVSKSLDDLRMKANRAKKMAGALNNFLRREMNLWVQGREKYIPMDEWRECAGEIPALELEDYLKERICYGGLDLSVSDDFTSFGMIFPFEDEHYYYLCRLWIPEDKVDELPSYRTAEDAAHIKRWVKAGLINTTPGNVIDYDFIHAQIMKDLEKFKIEQIAYDPYHANSVVQRLENEGVTMVKFRQGDISMNSPMKELPRLLYLRKLHHGNNHALTWMADNLVARQGATGLLKPDKEKSRDKIDGMVTLLMALDLAQRHPESTSVYEKRGVLRL